MFVCLFVCLYRLFGWSVGFLQSSSASRLYRERVPRLIVLPHTRLSWEPMTSVSAGHITPTQPDRTTAGIEPIASLPGVARSTAELPRPIVSCLLLFFFFLIKDLGFTVTWTGCRPPEFHATPFWLDFCGD